jgi:hypothetical protein
MSHRDSSHNGHYAPLYACFLGGPPVGMPEKTTPINRDGAEERQENSPYPISKAPYLYQTDFLARSRLQHFVVVSASRGLAGGSEEVGIPA